MFESGRGSAESCARRVGLAAALAAAAFVMSPAVKAAEQPGMRVVKDVETGALRAPTAEEAAVLDAGGSSSRSARTAPRGMLTGKVNPPAVTHADGTVEQELDESSMTYTIMRRNPDGSSEMVCVTGADAASAALKDKKSSVKTAKASNKGHSHDQK